MIEGQTFAEPGNEFQLLDFSVAMNIEIRAGFDSRQDGDETGGDSTPLSDPAGDGFFIGVAGRQILNGSAQFLSRTQGGVFHFSGKLLNPDFALDARTEIEKAEIFSTQKVKALRVAWTNFLREKMSSLFRRIPWPNEKSGLKRTVFPNNFYFIGGTVSIFKPLFGCGFAAL